MLSNLSWNSVPRDLPWGRPSWPVRDLLRGRPPWLMLFQVRRQSATMIIWLWNIREENAMMSKFWNHQAKDRVSLLQYIIFQWLGKVKISSMVIFLRVTMHPWLAWADWHDLALTNHPRPPPGLRRCNRRLYLLGVLGVTTDCFPPLPTPTCCALLATPDSALTQLVDLA